MNGVVPLNKGNKAYVSAKWHEVTFEKCYRDILKDFVQQSVLKRSELCLDLLI